jgi:AAA+ ATPase superfamily predicted ATPase
LVVKAAARQQAAQSSLDDFARAVASSSSPGASLARTGAFRAWDQALDATSLGAQRPVIVVIDEAPWLIESNEAFEGLVQRVWDQQLRHRPVMLILIGSDLAMMDALTSYGRPLYDRARIVRVEPLNPRDVGELTGSGAAGAFDAWAITGGFPNLVNDWQRGESVPAHLARILVDPGSRLIVSGERKLAAEFPPEVFARPVFEAVGSGAREHKRIAQRVDLPATTLERALRVLIDKRIIDRDVAYSATAGRNTRYVVADAHLRFWLRFISPNLSAIERGAGDLVAESVAASWLAWRGEAVEAVVREAVFRLLVRDRAAGQVAHVGHWWRRDHSVEIDIVAGDKVPVADSIIAVGSIKWRDDAPFTDTDTDALARSREQLPGGDTGLLIGCSRTGFAGQVGLDRAWHAEDLLQAWPG